jgi:pyruvate,water dikinase
MHLGARLQAKGLLAQTEDIFFLSVEEVETILMGSESHDKRDVITQRRAIYEKYKTYSPLPEMSNTEMREDFLLAGTAVSGGRITGRARVVSNPALSSLQQGEVLIAEYTDPGWMPLFSIAGAVVVEVGGMLSHTATLARELQKPAVFSVDGATRLIHDGQLITVDGWQGQIHLHSEETPL